MSEIKRPMSLQLCSTTTTPQWLAARSSAHHHHHHQQQQQQQQEQQRQQQPQQQQSCTSGTPNMAKRLAMESNCVRSMKSCVSAGSLVSPTPSTSSSQPSSPLPSQAPPSNSCHESPNSPSLILPYLYVGDQAQTQIDTISSLNISYVLSLQSLPKFLDSDIQLEHDDGEKQSLITECDIRDNDSQHATTRQLDSTNPMTLKTSSSSSAAAAATITTTKSSCTDASNIEAGTASCSTTAKDTVNGKDLLPSMNSSKDYLVKFKSCVNRLIKGKCINISDTFEQLVDKFFDETHNFIEEARRNKCNILVHCKAGISRSPTIAIAFLMKWKRLQLQDAYEFVKRCRPQISPNLNFMGQLMNYERKLLQGGLHNSPLPSPTTCCLLSHHQMSHEEWQNASRPDEKVGNSRIDS